MIKSIKAYRSDETIISSLNPGGDFKPVPEMTALTESVSGWVPPFKGADLCHQLETGRDRFLMCLETHEKILPAQIINQELLQELDEIEEREGRRPGRKEREQIKEKIRARLLPTAFVKKSRLYGWVSGQYLIVAGSEKQGDNFQAYLREAIGTLPITPVRFQSGSTLTEWFQNSEERPTGLEIQQDITLENDTQRSSHKNIDLEAVEISEALATGMRITRMRFSLEDKLVAVIDAGFSVKSIKFDDRLIEQAAESDDPITDWLLQTAAIEDLVALFIKYDLGEPAKEVIEDLNKLRDKKIEIALGGSPVVPRPTTAAYSGDFDPLYEQAKAFVIQSRKASISSVQRKLRIGYNRSARFMEQLESDGIVSAPGYNGAREVLVPSPGKTPA